MKLVRWFRGQDDKGQAVFDFSPVTDEEAQNVHMNGGEVVGDFVPAAPVAPEAAVAESKRVYSAPSPDLMSGTRPGQTYRSEKESMAQPVIRQPGSRRGQVPAVVPPSAPARVVDELSVPVDVDPEYEAARADSTPPARVRERGWEVARVAMHGSDERSGAAPDALLRQYLSLVSARTLLLREADRRLNLAKKRLVDGEDTDRTEQRIDSVIEIIHGLIKMDAGFRMGSTEEDDV
jgi:hypothetical protein